MRKGGREFACPRGKWGLKTVCLSPAPPRHTGQPRGLLLFPPIPPAAGADGGVSRRRSTWVDERVDHQLETPPPSAAPPSGDASRGSRDEQAAGSGESEERQTRVACAQTQHRRRRRGSRRIALAAKPRPARRRPLVSRKEPRARPRPRLRGRGLRHTDEAAGARFHMAGASEARRREKARRWPPRTPSSRRNSAGWANRHRRHDEAAGAAAGLAAESKRRRAAEARAGAPTPRCAAACRT